MRRAAALACALALGCAAPEEGRAPLPALDREVFARDVLPMLSERCASPTCHGRPERPLSLYAPGRWRADPSRTHLDEPLSPAEREHDLLACAALSIDPAPGAEALLARKPLAGGGLYHGGGAVFDGPTDRGYALLRAWMEGR